MSSTGLNGSYPLTIDGIDNNITRTSPGTYVLGRTNSDNTFIVEYVGRSDDDVNGRLKMWVDKGYTRFKFGYFDSPKAAFEKECNIYHDFGGPSGKLDNKIHPQRPEDSNWQCPRCDLFKTERGWY